MKGLSTLIKLQKTRVDEQRVILARLQDVLDQVNKAISDLEAQKIREQQAAKKNPEEAVTYGAFVKRALKRGQQLGRDRQAAEAAVLAARDKLAELFEEQKRYEIAASNRDAAQRKEIAQRERIELDEIGGVSHERRKAK